MKLIMLIALILMSCLISCSMLSHKSYLHYGAFYGRLDLKNVNKITSDFSELEISLEGTKYITYPDKEGVYYIENIKPGIYTLNFTYKEEILVGIENLEIKSNLLALIGNISESFERRNHLIKRWINISRYTELISPLSFGDLRVKFPLIEGKRLTGFVHVEETYVAMSDTTGCAVITKLPAGNFLTELFIAEKYYVPIVYYQVPIKSNQVLTMQPERFIKSFMIFEPRMGSWEESSNYTDKETKK